MTDIEKSIEEKAIEARRAYQRMWRANNKDKVRSYNENFWKKQAKKSDVMEVDSNENENN